MARTRVLFIAPSMGAGGAERVLTTLLRHLPSELFDLHLALVNKTGPLLSDVPSHVVMHDLNAGRVRRAAWPLLRCIRRLAPNVVFSTASHLNVVVTLLRRFMPRGTRLVVREVNVSNVRARSRAWRTMRKRALRTLLPKADAIVCQSEFMRDDLCQNLGLPRHKTTVIYNPVDFLAVGEGAEKESPFPVTATGPKVLAVGSMDSPKKGLDRLIRAFPALVKRRPQASLWILGEGRLAPTLKALADELGVGHCTYFPGYQKNPYRWFRHADLYVMSSRHEGTPNVLLEATACNCPVVVLDHPGGTREVMGLLGQPSRVVSSLDAWEPQWFQAPAPQVRACAKRHFAAAKIAQHYTSLLHKTGNTDRLVQTTDQPAAA